MSAPQAHGLAFWQVPQHVARNPIARALARARLRQSCTEFALQLYSLPPGAYVASEALAASRVLMVAMHALVLTQRGESPDARVIAGGVSTLAQLSERGWRWRTVDAPAIDAALVRARDVMAAAPAQLVQRAWIELERAHP